MRDFTSHHDTDIERAVQILRSHGMESDAAELLRVWGMPDRQKVSRQRAIRSIWTVCAAGIGWLLSMVWIVDAVYAATGEQGFGFLALVVWFIIGAAAALTYATRRGAFD